MKQKLFLLLVIFLMGTNSAFPAEKANKKQERVFPEEYEVYQKGHWELRIFYWNRHNGNHITHGMLFFNGNEIPNGTADNIMDTSLGKMRYFVREDDQKGTSGWIPDGGMFLDMYKSNKKLHAGDFKKININNNGISNDEDGIQANDENGNRPSSKTDDEEMNRYDLMSD